MLKLIPKPYRKWPDQVSEEVALSSHVPERQNYGEELIQERWSGSSIAPFHKYEMENPFPAIAEVPNHQVFEWESRPEMDSRFRMDMRDTQDFWNTGFSKGFINTEKQTRLEASLSQSRANEIQNKYIQPIAHQRKAPIGEPNPWPITQLQEGLGRNMIDPVDTDTIMTSGRRFERAPGQEHIKGTFYTPNENVWVTADGDEGGAGKPMQWDAMSSTTQNFRKRTLTNVNSYVNVDGHNFEQQAPIGPNSYRRARRRIPNDTTMRFSNVPSEYVPHMIGGGNDVLQEREPTKKRETYRVAPNQQPAWTNPQRDYLTLRMPKKRVYDFAQTRPKIKIPIGAHLEYGDAPSHDLPV